MSKVYFFAIFLLAASFTGCIGGEDLEELTTEEESTTEDDTIEPVGEDNVTNLKKEIDDLKAKISDYEKPSVSFIDHNATSKLFCEEDAEEIGCYLVAKAFDVNGVIERYSWSSSEPDSINMSDGEMSGCQDFLIDDNGNCLSLYDWFSLDICEDIQKEVNQTITITVYDNDGNSASASYDLDYDSSCVPPESAPVVTLFVLQDSSGVYHIEVIKVSVQVELEHFSFFLKDGSGSTYVGGNGFGEVAMQMIAGEAHGIDTSYTGDDDALKERANDISNDNGEIYPVHFSDNDRDGMLSAGDQFLVHGQGNGCDNCVATDDWKLDIQYDPNGDIVGSARLI